MGEIIVMAGFAVPPALLVAGLFLLGLAVPSARETLARWSGVPLATLVLIAPGVLCLLFLLAWRGDGDTSVWADAGTGLRVVFVAALLLAAGGVMAQGWVILRWDVPPDGRELSAAAGIAGAAMLGLVLALILAWLALIG